MNKSESELTQDDSKSPWQKTQHSNLVRYVPSNTYFARIRIGGKLIRQSLKTKVLSVAKLKLADLEKKERVSLERQGRLHDGKTVFADLIEEYRERLETREDQRDQTEHQDLLFRAAPCSPEKLACSGTRRRSEAL